MRCIRRPVFGGIDVRSFLCTSGICGPIRPDCAPPMAHAPQSGVCKSVRHPPSLPFILERGQHFKFRRKFRVVFISVAQNSRQIFATVIRNILADPPQANVPHAANARRIQHLQKCFGAFTTKTDCKYLWHVITIADLRQNRNRGLSCRVHIQAPQHFCNMFKTCRFFYGL